MLDIIHEFDLANFLLGPAEVVFARAKTSGQLEISSEDSADIILDHGDKLTSSIHLGYITPPTRRCFSIGGVGGIMDVDLVARSIKVFDGDNNIRSEKIYKSTDDADYLLEMESFANCIKDNIRPKVSGLAALEILRQVLAARKLAGISLS